MIPARKTRRFVAWFSRHAERRIQGNFAAVRVRGLEHLEAALAAAPVLLVANHTSWWDPLICLLVGHRMVRCDGYAMMDADNLRRLPFFGRVGAFGVERSGPGLGAESLDYAVDLLDRPGRLIWVFPQGDERPINLRPLGFRRGAAVIWERAPTAIPIPLAIRYVFAEREQPYLYLSFRAAVAPVEGVEARRLALEGAVTAELDRIEAHLRTPDPGFVDHLRRRRSRADRLAERMLAWVNRRHALPRD